MWYELKTSMKRLYGKYGPRLAAGALVLLLLMPLTACQTVFGNDKAGECGHPFKPLDAGNDVQVAEFVVKQAMAIDVCRALLGETT